MFGEVPFDGFANVRRIDDSLIGGFGRVVACDGFRADTFFIDEFDGGAEEVVEESPFLGIEVIKGWDDIGII